MNYYNENDPKAAQWLRNLVSAGLIPPGEVDDRSIVHVVPSDIAGYTQCHFFAGIGGWAEALRLAGIPATTRLWTGSCPCQPFSAAGQRKGTADERHLWPVFRDLIAECRPPVVFGEQVASADGRDWLSTVRAEMEALAYAVGAADLCAAGIGAPHLRQRLYFVGLADAEGIGSWAGLCHCEPGTEWRDVDPHRSRTSRLAFSADERCQGLGLLDESRPEDPETARDGKDGRLADTDDPRPQGRERVPQRAGERPAGQGSVGGRVADTGRPSPPDSFWAAADWLYCRDGRWRPVEPAAQQMVDGLSCAVGFLRADKTLKEELINASKTSDIAGQVLRSLRENHAPTEIWWSIGRRIGLPQTTLLLAALCEQSRELGDILHGKAQGGSQDIEEPLPKVLDSASADACPPHGRRCAEQLTWELGDALSELPQTCPSARPYLPLLAEFTGSPLAEKVPGRVGRLRGYGNAIVPQVAATFIRAALMPCPSLHGSAKKTTRCGTPEKI